MAKRTLAQFRMEQSLWRKDIAQKLDISEEAVAALEREPQVPPEIAQKITAAYNLPPDYFTADVVVVATAAGETQEGEQKQPFLYFFFVALVWRVVFGVISAIAFLPTMFLPALEFEVTSFFYLMQSLWSVVISLVSGICLSKYIRKKNRLSGDIVNYEFLYPYLSGKAVAWTTELFNLLILQVTSQSPYLYSGLVLLSPSIPLGFLVSALFTAALLQTANTEPGEKKNRHLRLLLCTTVGAYVLATVFNVLANDQSNGGFVSYFSRGIEFLLLVVVIICVFIGEKQAPNRRKLWFTIPPVIALLLPQLISFSLAIFSK